MKIFLANAVLALLLMFGSLKNSGAEELSLQWRKICQKQSALAATAMTARFEDRLLAVSLDKHATGRDAFILERLLRRAYDHERYLTTSMSHEDIVQRFQNLVILDCLADPWKLPKTSDTAESQPYPHGK